MKKTILIKAITVIVCKKIFACLPHVFYIFCIFHLHIVSAQGTWTQKANHAGGGRWIIVGFSIGAKGYIGTGIDAGGITQAFWEWDQATDVWTQKAPFGGTPRYYAAAFAIGSKGYIGTGIGAGGLTQDFWEWDQVTNVWTQRANFGGGPRMRSRGFSIGNKGYFAAGDPVGNYSMIMDLWEYDPNLNPPMGTWTAKANFPGTPRLYPTLFSICGKGYLANGYAMSGGSSLNDFWEYDPVIDTWTQKANFPGTPSNQTVGFGLGTKGYMGIGRSGYNGTFLTQFYEYDPSTNTWTVMASFAGSPRAYSTGFSICNKGFVGTGFNGGVLDDFWEFTSVSNNPPTTQINATCYYSNDATATVYPTCGAPPYTYSWNTLPVQTTATATGLVVGSYIVNILDSLGCTSTAIVNIISANIPPVATFTATTACFNNPTVFIDQSTENPTQWNWNFGDSNTSTLQNPSHTYNAAGAYFVTLIATNSSGCSDTSSMNVVVNPLPTVNFIATTVCVGNQTCFTDSTTISSGSITGRSWDFGDPTSPNNISNVQDPCHLFTAAGNYVVTLTSTSDSGCQSTIVLPVLVNTVPVAGFTASNVCLNVSTLFNNTSSGATQWNWNFGDGNNSLLQNPSHTYTAFGNFIVTQIATSAGNCIDTIVDSITVFSIPIVNFIASTVCLGDTTTFTDLSSIPTGTLTSWNWNFGDGNTSLLQNPIHAYTSSGIYNVTLTATSNNNCQTAFTIPATVYAKPIANFSYTTGAEMLMDAVVFKDLSISNIISWAWDLGDGTLSTLMNPTHLYTDTGTYLITLTVVDNNGCKDTANYSILMQEFNFYIPNSFTPNGDENNEFFFGRGIGIIEYEMWIFNRWGDLIFNCYVNDLPQTLPCRWNGMLPGGTTIYQQDVYVWKVQIKSIFQKEYNFMGHVNILR